MKYLLVDWTLTNESITDLTELSDEEFAQLAQSTEGGMVIDSTEEFTSRFNAEHFNTSTHQLRIIKN